MIGHSDLDFYELVLVKLITVVKLLKMVLERYQKERSISNMLLVKWNVYATEHLTANIPSTYCLTATHA